MPKQTRSRLSKPMAAAVQHYTASIAYDRRLAPYDIAGSIAHARMLGAQGIIPQRDAAAIIEGLGLLQTELDKGTFPFREDLEDIHMNIEVSLSALIGDAAGKLHTARSRNDQVALDMRLFVKSAAAKAAKGLRALQAVLLDQAEAHAAAIMPGYTHLQRAQPVLLAHHLLAYFEMFQRDADRFADCIRRSDVMPLGSGAMAGSPYPLDRETVAHELGFSRVSVNSMDAVSDRDFVLDFHAAGATAMMHLSRLSEELILWSSSEFAFLEMDDAYTTGSSSMPQKKNPDVAELARARTGRVYGNLMAALAIMKGLPLTYNRDLQEDKEALFSTVDILDSTLDVFEGMLATATFNIERMAASTGQGYILATDVADYLAKKGMPFREAHRIVGEVVQYGVAVNKELPALTLAEYRKFSDAFDKDVLAITADASVRSRDVPGGTGHAQVKRALKQARRSLARAGGSEQK